jgi:hypothetical protein
MKLEKDHNQALKQKEKDPKLYLLQLLSPKTDQFILYLKIFINAGLIRFVSNELYRKNIQAFTLEFDASKL